MFLPQEIIRKKRDGGELGPDEIEAFVAGLVDGRVADAQAGAFAMAVCLRGMSVAETVALTRAMARSGRVLSWPDLPGPVVDKHSTGGIGDKVSLILAPLVAACDAYVPMLSGRGLGHTGGTLDKLESIPGYRAEVDLERFRSVVREVGCAIVGATGDLAPADRRLYAIRDVTATVESIPLITASILSKKLAAGPSALVMDVKVGSGAFLPGLDQARALARSIVEVAEGAGLACRALLTDMSRCLGRAAGNALEVAEAISVLRGEPADPALLEVTMALAAELLVMGGSAEHEAAARDTLAKALSDGRAAERFARMVTALGGPSDLLERPERRLPMAPVREPLDPPRPGWVARIDGRALGVAIVRLGVGRALPGAPIDPAVGLSRVVAPGERVGDGVPLCFVHARDRADVAALHAELRAAFEITETPPVPTPLVYEKLAPSARP
ncbi:MAG: thymidine phosphorylase [Geminicoccaceae bacterium]|jgi:thymidine phosphorylase|nr:MAG: thymidine phosphorylase [Geminicoccaceae bacterium]